ncbi:MAG: ParA family protein [Lachnospiraceae bacterium]|nr:ParA family protein [Lachnospiraceae bacterium]MDD3617729.1 ParA family protein [Lachnospiraceae bacterium]NCB94310.1 ParA family protein [Clostridia bacterium]NCC44972.1 ParA family protein [Clostridia bacterium]
MENDKNEKRKCRVVACCNQKGGVGKTTTCVNLGIGLASKGQKVLLIDCDAQGSMTASLGYEEPDRLEITLSTILTDIIQEEKVNYPKGILQHAEGVDLLPSNIELSGMEISIVNIMSRETILRRYIEEVKQYYDWILIDCTPSLGMLTINALTCADKVLIPVQAAYLPIKGMEQLIKTIGQVRRQLNPKLEIEGILLTMVDCRTNYAKDILELIQEAYGEHIRIFQDYIPFSVRAAETSAEGISIFSHDPKGKVAQAYQKLTQEVMADEIK